MMKASIAAADVRCAAVPTAFSIKAAPRKPNSYRIIRTPSVGASALRVNLRSRLRFPARRRRRHIARQTTLPGVNFFAAFETRQSAGDHCPGRRQTRKAFTNRGQRHLRLLGNFQVQPLTVFLQAFQDFHDSSNYAPIEHCKPGWRAPTCNWRQCTSIRARTRPLRRSTRTCDQVPSNAIRGVPWSPDDAAAPRPVVRLCDGT